MNNSDFYFNGDMMTIESDRLSECIQYIQNNNVSSIYICDLYYELNNLDFIRECPGILSININCRYIENVEGLYDIKGLKEIILQDINCTVDLSHFPSLESFSGDWNKNYSNIETLKYLKTIRFDKYNPKSKTLKELTIFNKLEFLMIVRSTIDSLEGIEDLPKLKIIDFNYFAKLSSIKEIVKAKKLEKVSFESCKKITDFDVLKNNKNLKSITIDNCGEIDSIEFISSLEKLNFFVCLRMNILDENISFCEKIDYYAVDDKYIRKRLKEKG